MKLTWQSKFTEPLAAKVLSIIIPSRYDKCQSSQFQFITGSER
jgi:hypothetical protein